MGLNQSRGILKEIMLDVPSFLSRKKSNSSAESDGKVCD